MRRRRMAVCLVARARMGVDAASGAPTAADSRSSSHSAATSSGSSTRVVGYALLSVAQPLALLPPPFPSAAPPQLHIDGLAVAAAARRRGVGRALLAAAERLARLWAWPSLWLDVDASNAVAVQLYSELGYTIVQVQRSGAFSQRRVFLMRKLVSPAGARPRAKQEAGICSSSSSAGGGSGGGASGGSEAAVSGPAGQHPNPKQPDASAPPDALSLAPQAEAAAPAAAAPVQAPRVYNWSDATSPLQRGARSSNSDCLTTGANTQGGTSHRQ